MSELFGIWMSGPKHELCDSCRKRPAVADRELLKNLWNLRNKTSESHELSMEGISQRAGRSLQGIFCSLLTLDSRCFNPKAPNAAACTMSIVVEVGLLSGKTAALKAGLDEKVEELKIPGSDGTWNQKRVAAGLSRKCFERNCTNQGFRGAVW